MGRLPLSIGDAAPPVEIDPGRLSPTRLLINDSISRRLSALPGVGDINCAESQLGQEAHLRQGKSDITTTYTGTTATLTLTKLPLALEFGKLRLFGENLVPSLLHVGAALQWPISGYFRI